MIKLKVDSKRNLSFIERDRILQGEHKFDTLQISLPEKIDSNDEHVSDMLIKIFFVHDKDRVTRQVIPDQDLNVETVIDYTLTEKARRWLVYVCFYKVGDEDIEVGKTNPVAVSVNHIPYNEALDIKNKDPDILLFKGDKGDKGDPGKDGKDGEQGPPGEKGDKGDPGKDGTNDYNDLDNKPRFVVANAPDGWGINIPVQGVIELMTFYLQSGQDNRKVLRVKDNAIAFSMLSSALQKEMFKDYGQLKDIPNDFFTNSSSVPYANALWDIRRTDLLGMPIPARGWLFNYLCGTTRIQFYLTDYFNDLEYQFRLFFRVQYMGGFHEWIELTGGGSQIASGVVNQNGTISFYDADGNLLFTTTGESVIGPQGAPGQDYVLTAQDKTDIANIVLQELPTTQGVLYGD